MKKIVGTDGMTATEINMELQKGGKFVIYQYCVSVLILTFKRSSDIYFIRADENAVSKSLVFTLLSLVAGWWGIPWGPIWTITTVVTNLRGGKDVTAQVVASLNQRAA